MQTLSIVKLHHSAQLMDELIAGVPTFMRVTTGDERVADPDAGRVDSIGNSLTVTFADDIASADVLKVIIAHTPVAEPPPRNYREDYAAAATDAERVDILARHTGLK